MLKILNVLLGNRDCLDKKPRIRHTAYTFDLEENTIVTGSQVLDSLYLDGTYAIKKTGAVITWVEYKSQSKSINPCGRYLVQKDNNAKFYFIEQ